MEKLKELKPMVTEIAGDRVVLPKSTFNDIIKQINLLTDTVNILMANQKEIHSNLATVVTSLDILQ